MSSLADRSCRACATGGPPLDPVRASALLDEIPGWKISGGKLLRREVKRLLEERYAS